MVNGRITGEQMARLEERAGELDGNLSAALLQAITDARLLEMARASYQELLRENPDFQIPNFEDGSTSIPQIVASCFVGTEAEDARLREPEPGEKA